MRRRLFPTICLAVAAVAVGAMSTVPAAAAGAAPPAAGAAPPAAGAAPPAAGAAPAVAPPAVAAPGNQPYASYWHPSTILSWSPTTDPDAAFNRSRVPLRPRSVDPALKANANARAGEGRIAALAAFAPTSNNPSQGSRTSDYYAFPHWQYIDTLVFWGGSASEGLILAPNPTVIDAAHRNGVKVYGTVFFPPTVFGGQYQWVRDFIQRSGATFPVADKLVEVARHYGFDGWFINQETDGGTAADATALRDFQKYARSRGPVEFMWYDSMIESGPIAWQNALNAQNDAFLEDNGRVADSMFLNFWWRSQVNSRTHARSIGRSEFDLYAGIDTEARGYETPVFWDGIFPAGQPHVTSLGIYRPEWTWKSSPGNRNAFYAKDARFWVGANGDPSDTTTSHPWKGLATYIAEATPVTAKPFVTSFNAGHGDAVYTAGQRVATGGWNNLSLQDVPPTYRWIVQSGRSRLTPAIDFTDAYEGGSSLSLSGRLDATNTVRLYQTRLPVAADTRLSVVVRTPAAGPTRLKAAVAFTDAPTSFVDLELGATTGTGWERKTLDLAPFAGRTIAQLGLRVSAPRTVLGYSIKVGQLAIYDGTVDAPAAASGVRVLGSTDVSPTRKSLRLAWTPSSTPVHHYDVFRRNPDGTRTYLGGTPNDAYFVSQLDRVGTEATTTLDVVAVSGEFGRAPAATVSVSWGDPVATNLAQGRPATASGRCNADEGPEKAVNGSVSGGESDKWCTLTAAKWLEVDLGSARSLTRFVVRHAEAGGESRARNTRDFTIQVRSTPAEPWRTVATGAGNTAATTTHEVAVGARHVRLSVTRPTQSSDPAARIYEFEAWGS